MNNKHTSVLFNTSLLSEEELIERIGFDSGYAYGFDDEGQPKTLSSDDGDLYIRKCRNIDCDIREIAQSDIPASDSQVTRAGLTRKYLTKIGDKLKSAFKNLSRLEEVFEHSPHIELFIDCLKEVGINRQEGESTTITKLSKLRYQDEYKLFDEIIFLIRSKSKQNEFKRKLTLSREKVNRRMIQAESHLNKIFQKRSKVLAVRVDLSYRKDPNLDLQLDRIKSDLKKLLNNRRNKKSIFSDLLGYIWKIESGINRGLHLHCIFFYDGHRHKKDTYFGHEIGRYWSQVVTKEGNGCFFNCNSNKRKYDQVGIGMILRDDIEKRSILLNRVVSYLAKSDTVISAKVLKGQKCFSVGQV